MRIAALALASFVLASASLALPATDVYVNAAIGSDVTGNGSSSAPWRTVTHALAAVSGPGVVVHVAAGLYDAALGEQFPLQLESGVSIVGAGPDATELRADPAKSVLRDYGFSVGPSTLLADMTLSHGYIGVDTINASPSLLRLRFDQCDRGVWMDVGVLAIVDCEARDCFYGYLLGDKSGAIRDSRAVGCNVGLQSTTSHNAVAPPLIERFTALACSFGLSVAMAPNAPNPLLVVREATLDSCAIGAAVGDPGWGGPFDVASYVFERCRITACTTAGVSTLKSGSGKSRATRLLSSVVDHCTVGVMAYGDTYGTHAVFVDDSTITGCGTGLYKAASGAAAFRMSNAIVWGNAIDVLSDSGGYATEFAAGWTDVHAPPIASFGPLYDVDPQFANPSAGDYRLLTGSPLIDAGDPAHATGGMDHDRDPRVLDGVGTGLARVDVGANEHNRVHLTLSGIAVPGAVLGLSVDGPAGWAHATALSAAVADLSIGNLGSVLIAPFPMLLLGQALLPAQFQASVPPDPALQGAVFHLQSLAIDVPTGIGSASNAVELEIQ